MTRRPRIALGVALCAAGLLGFAATYFVLAATRPDGPCSAALHVGCDWPPVWALLLGVFGTLGSFALVVTGVLALLVSVASAREERARAYLDARRARISPSAVRAPQ